MENTTITPEKKGSNGKKILVIIVVILLLGINGVLIWMLMNKNQVIVETKEVLRVETTLKDSLTVIKDQLSRDFEEMKSQNVSLNEKLTEKDKEIADQAEKIQNLLNSGDKAQLEHAKAEIRKFKSMLASYGAQKDSLLQVTAALNQDKLLLTTNLGQEKVKSESLTTENTKLSEKVTVGSILRADNVKAMAVKFKSNGKEIETNKAKASQKIKTCFTLLENHVAEKGEKEVFIRVLGPEGSAFSSSSETFKYNGQETLFTARESVPYENKKKEVCVYWANTNAFGKGKYTVEIYNAGTQIGKTAVELK